MATYKQKLSLLESLGEIKYSKNGNAYIVLQETVNTVTKVHSLNSITKNFVYKIGTEYSYKEVKRAVLMLTTANKIKFRPIDKTNFSLLNINLLRSYAIYPQLAQMYFFGKKCEFLKNYDRSFLRNYNFLKSFTSFKEVWKFLGVTSNLDCTVDNVERALLGQFFSNVNIALNCDVQLLQDTLNMAKALNFDLKSSKKSVLKLHDELIVIQNLKNAENYSSVEVVPKWFEEIEKLLTKNFTIKFHKSPRELFLAGQIMHNCIAGRIHSLPNYVFFTVTINNVNYIAQCNYKIREIKAKYNNYCPMEITEEIDNLIKPLKSIITNTPLKII